MLTDLLLELPEARSVASATHLLHTVNRNGGLGTVTVAHVGAIIARAEAQGIQPEMGRIVPEPNWLSNGVRISPMKHGRSGTDLGSLPIDHAPPSVACYPQVWHLLRANQAGPRRV